MMNARKHRRRPASSRSTSQARPPRSVGANSARWGPMRSCGPSRDTRWNRALPLNAMLGCQVFDGVHIHISGASLNSQNQMFGRPGEKGDDAFPFTYATLFDPVSRRTDGWLARCQAEGNCPKVIHTDSENEVWTAGGLLYADTQGRDIGFPANVRTYLFASTRHGPASSLERARTACEPVSHRCQRLAHSLRHDTRGKARRCAALRQGLDTRSPPGPRGGTSRHAQRERFPTGMT